MDNPESVTDPSTKLVKVPLPELPDGLADQVYPTFPVVSASKAIDVVAVGNDHLVVNDWPLTDPQSTPEGASPFMVQPCIDISSEWAAAAFVPYCIPVPPRTLDITVGLLALHPLSVAE